MKKPNILVVDDEKVILQLFERSFTSSAFDLHTAASGQEALDKARQTPYNLIITDVKMPGISGVDVLKTLKKENPYTEIIIITGHPSIELAVESIKIGATDFICKPFDLNLVRGVIESSLERQKFALNYLEAGELKKMMEISKTITNATSMDLLLDRILDVVLMTTGAQQGWVMMRDERSDTLKVTTKRELSQVIADEMSAPTTSVNEINNLCDDKISIKTDFSKDVAACISLYSRGRQIGGINITARQSGEPFTLREKAILSIFTSQVSLAVENLRLLKKLSEVSSS